MFPKPPYSLCVPPPLRIVLEQIGSGIRPRGCVILLPSVIDGMALHETHPWNAPFLRSQQSPYEARRLLRNRLRIGMKLASDTDRRKQRNERCSLTNGHWVGLAGSILSVLAQNKRNFCRLNVKSSPVCSASRCVLRGRVRVLFRHSCPLLGRHTCLLEAIIYFVDGRKSLFGRC